MTRRSGIQLCYPFEERRLAKWQPPYFAQPKLDGERCRAVFDPEHGYHLLSSEQNEIKSVPHIIAALNRTGLQYELDGELYRHTMPFHEIHSRVGRTVNLHPGHDEVDFHIFDLVDEELVQLERTLELFKYRDHFEPPLRLVKHITCYNFDEVMDAYESFIAGDYEGIIVRNLDAPYLRRRSTWVMKFKPKKDDWYYIIGAYEELDKHGQPKDSLGALVCTSDEGTAFQVGSGFTHEQRQLLWRERSSLPGKLCHVQYQHITPGRGVPRFPVFVEVMDPKGALL